MALAGKGRTNAELIIHSSQKANKQVSKGGRSQHQSLGTSKRVFSSFLNDLNCSDLMVAERGRESSLPGKCEALGLVLSTAQVGHGGVCVSAQYSEVQGCLWLHKFKDSLVHMRPCFKNRKSGRGGASQRDGFLVKSSSFPSRMNRI